MQLAAFFILNPLGVVGLTAVCLPVLNCHACPMAWTTCPIGAFGTTLSIGVIPWLALGSFGLVGTLFGRFTCGWICPFGFAQDLTAKLPVPKWNPPPWTRWIKYGVLIGTVFLVPILLGIKSRLFFCRTCPVGTISGSGWYWFFHDQPIAWVRIAFLLGFLTLILFVRRGFCGMICPIGAGLAVFNRISLLSIKYLPRWCSKCLKCLRVCPTGIGPMEDPRDPECMYCMDCFKCSALEADLSPEEKS